MESASNTAGKSANSGTGRASAPLPGDARDMLTRADFGCHCTGRIDFIGPVTHRSGKGATSGKDFSFWEQKIVLAMGGPQVEVAYISETAPAGDIIPREFELDQIVKIAAEKPRVFNGRVSFQAKQ